MAASSSRGLFFKENPTTVAFEKTGNGTAQIKAGTIVDVGGTTVTFTTEAKVVVMPANHKSFVGQRPSAFQHAAHEIFLLNDLDGDGFITREEWLGTDAVFDALDTDHDGRLHLEDVRGGLGAALAVSSS